MSSLLLVTILLPDIFKWALERLTLAYADDLTADDDLLPLPRPDSDEVECSILSLKIMIHTSALSTEFKVKLLSSLPLQEDAGLLYCGFAAWGEDFRERLMVPLLDANLFCGCTGFSSQGKFMEAFDQFWFVYYEFSRSSALPPSFVQHMWEKRELLSFVAVEKDKIFMEEWESIPAWVDLCDDYML